MSELVTFYCDFCGTKEEQTTWAPADHCRVELVVPNRRLIVTPAALPPSAMPLSGPFAGETSGGWFVPSVPPIGSDGSPVEPGPENEERWAVQVCDRCAKRLAALFELRFETPADIAARVHGAAAPREVYGQEWGRHDGREPAAPSVYQGPFPPPPNSTLVPEGRSPSPPDDLGSAIRGSRGKVVVQHPNMPGAGMPIDRPVAQFPTPGPNTRQREDGMWEWRKSANEPWELHPIHAAAQNQGVGAPQQDGAWAPLGEGGGKKDEPNQPEA